MSAAPHSPAYCAKTIGGFILTGHPDEPCTDAGLSMLAEATLAHRDLNGRTGPAWFAFNRMRIRYNEAVAYGDPLGQIWVELLRAARALADALGEPPEPPT